MRLFFALSFCLFSSTLFAKPLDEKFGFLGFSLSLQGEYAAFTTKESANPTQRSSHPTFLSSLVLEGATLDYSISTRLTLLHDFAHLKAYFTGSPREIPKHYLYTYTFFQFETTYHVFGKERIFFHAGISLGHQGFLHSSIKNPTYTISPAFVTGIRWFISKKLLLSTYSDILLPIFNTNISSLVFQRNRIEILLDPKGGFFAPRSFSVLYTLGLINENVLLQTKNNVKITKNSISMIFRISFIF